MYECEKDVGMGTQSVVKWEVGEQTLEVVTLKEYLNCGGYLSQFVYGIMLPLLSMVCTCIYDALYKYPADVILK